MSEPRTCLRTGCRWPAAASLSFRYASRQVWVADPAADADPSRYDLCSGHADTLTVPRGWERIDERSVADPPRPEPAPDDVADSSPQRPPATDAPRRNRYAPLLADLPRVAATHRAAEARRKAGKLAATAPPQAADDDPWRAWTQQMLEGETIPQAEGQLAMPVDEQGIVVPIELAGVRRRTERAPTA